MTESPYPQLAKQFIAMWQDQLSNSLMDERFVSQMIDLMHQGQTMPFAGVNPNAAPSASNSAVPSEPSGDVVGKLERRLAAAEAKLASMEAELRKLKQPVSNDAANGDGHGTTPKRRRSGANTKKHQSS